MDWTNQRMRIFWTLAGQAQALEQHLFIMAFFLRVRSARQRLEPSNGQQPPCLDLKAASEKTADAYLRSHKNTHAFATIGLSFVNSSELLKVQHSMGSELCRELSKLCVLIFLSVHFTQEAAAFYTKHLLRQLSFYYTRNLLNQKPLTKNTLYGKLLFTPETCMPKRLLPMKPLTPKSLSHTKNSCTKSQKAYVRASSCHKSRFTLTPKDFYTRNV